MPTKSVERSKSARETNINLRTTANERELIAAAAVAKGKTVTSFVIETAKQEAINVLLDRRLFTAEGPQFDAFVAALDNPRPAGQKLKALMKRKPVRDE